MRTVVLLASLCFALSACKSSTVDTNTGQQGLVVHEWGTFTSMSDSTGTPLVGLHHEDEPLPDFVYRRSRESVRRQKGAEALPVGVTQKLETPVVYFYSPTAQTVDLEVGFPKGLISEWFPNATDFAPALDPSAATLIPANGAMRWRADLIPAMGTTSFPGVSPEDIWAPSRQVASTPLRTYSDNGPEDEQFIFYRGIGEFRLPFEIVANADGTLDVINGSDDDSPAVFLLRVHEGGGAIVPLGALPRRGAIRNVTPPASGKERNLDQYVVDAKTQIRGALIDSGLYADEAQAMVDTWSRSYFQSFGLRVLYVVPRQWTDALLPMKLSPAPSQLVRTLVGRVEVLTRADETQLQTTVADAFAAGRSYDALLAELGRFAEPKLRRVGAMASSAALKTYIEGAITAGNAIDTTEP